MPGHDTNPNLVFSKCFVRNTSEASRVICFCLLNLSHAIDLLPVTNQTMINAGILIDTALEILRKNDLRYKNASLSFIVFYYKNANTEKDKFLEVFVRVNMEMSSMWVQLNELIKSKLVKKQYFVNIFQKSFRKFLNFAREHVKGLELSKFPEMTAKLTNSLAKLLYHETVYSIEHHIPSHATFIGDIINAILIDVQFDKRHIEAFDKLECLCEQNSEPLHLLNFKIVLELESATAYDCKVSKISNTWNKIHLILMQKVASLHTQMLLNDLYETIQWIKDAIEMTTQVDFHFTRRHQLKHGLNFLCKCENVKKLPNENSLMKFKNWSYQHITLDFFEDLPTVVAEIIQILKQSQTTCLIPEILVNVNKIFTKLLHSLPQLTDENKLFMLAMIILPFYPAFEKFDKVNKSHEFKKMQSCLSSSLISFVQKNPPDFQKALKLESIKLIAQLKFNKISSTSMWLGNSICRFILMQEEKEIQLAFVKRFKDVLISNMEAMPTFINLYQNIRLNKTMKLEFEELRDILCLNDKDVMLLRNNSFEYQVFCNQCEQEPDATFPREENMSVRRKVEIWMAHVSRMKSILISTDAANVAKISKIQINSLILNNQNVEFCTAFIKNIPACIKHTHLTELFRVKSGDEFFKIILQNDKKLLKRTDFYFKRIIVSIQKSNVEDRVKTAVFERLLVQLLELTKICCRKTGIKSTQYHVANMVATFGTYVRNDVATYGNKVMNDAESVSLSCLELLTYFMIINESEIKGVAGNLALRLLEANGIVFGTFINWHKKLYLQHVIRLCLMNTADCETPKSIEIKLDSVI